MGIPGFFGWLLKKYDKSVFTSYKINAPRTDMRGVESSILTRGTSTVDELYIDANCMLHPSCFKILKRANPIMSNDILESEMINKCITDLDYLIKYVNPTTKLFVAVDGVAPLAKISQQRKRRYKSYDDTIRKNIIKQKFNVPLTHSWTNASITPGTLFMEKLHEKLYAYLQTLSKPIQIIYSSYHTCGEGEHKIFDHIRKQNTNLVRVIYGLDADLIFLSMACKKQNIFLIREEMEFRTGQESKTLDQHDTFTYVNIDTIIQCFNELVYDSLVRATTEINKHSQNIQKDNINDIIFICYFLGNDFIPHVPSIDIKKYGMDMLLESYVHAYITNTTPLITYIDGKIQLSVLFFNDFLAHLAICEKDWFSQDSVRVSRESHCTNPCDDEIWKLDNMLLVKPTDIFQKYIGTFDDWKFRYYEHYFHCSESQEQMIKSICKNYIDGVMWIAKYYFGECPSWTWVYEYQCAPFVTDLNKFMQTHHYNVNNHEFELSKPLQPITQLMCVIPKTYSYLLPDNYSKLMNDESPIGDMFPSKFTLDICNKDMFWQCNPILPHLNIERVTEITDTLKQTAQTKKLNQIMDHIVIK